MFATPKPGETVTVTVRHRNSLLHSKDEWIYNTYENVTVLKPFHWLGKHEFCIPADGPESLYPDIESFERLGRKAERFTTRVIHMRSVTEITNGIETEESGIHVIEIPNSKNTSTYSVRIEDGVAVHCECKGFQFRSKCRHLKEAEEKHANNNTTTISDNSVC